MKKRIIEFIALLLLVTVCLCGCVRFRASVEVSSTGKISMEILYAMSDTVAGLSASGTPSLTDEQIAEYEAKGYTCTPYAQDGYSGFVLSKTGMDDMSDGIMDNDVELKQSGSNFVLDIPWNKGKDGSDASSLTAAAGIIQAQGGFAELVLTLPTEPVAHNATSVSEDGKTLTWNLLAMGDRESIHVEYSLASLLWIWGKWVLLAVAAAAVVVILVIVIVRNIKKKKKTASAETSGQPDDFTTDDNQ